MGEANGPLSGMEEGLQQGQQQKGDEQTARRRQGVTHCAFPRHVDWGGPFDAWMNADGTWETIESRITSWQLCRAVALLRSSSRAAIFLA
ncbi:MAG TPA: hypothetical protein VG013_09985 [Gemmataceae bacterium]|jgi:hypothetical protein|nr:hypothetical protein [Gemmataceae bacterium]